MSSDKDYWQECIETALEEAGIDATKEQISAITEIVQGAHENYGMAFGYDCIPNPLVSENKRLEEALKREKRKIVCKECNGKGYFVSQGPYHSSEFQCHVCHGEGMVIP